MFHLDIQFYEIPLWVSFPHFWSFKLICELSLVLNTSTFLMASAVTLLVVLPFSLPLPLILLILEKSKEKEREGERERSHVPVHSLNTCIAGGGPMLRPEAQNSVQLSTWVAETRWCGPSWLPPRSCLSQKLQSRAKPGTVRWDMAISAASV